LLLDCEPLEDCVLFEDCGLLDLLLLFELPDERAVDDFGRDELERDFVVALLALAPAFLAPFLDAPVPFLDVELEREVEPPARFACARPRLLPRRD
jgi:hypothetical protein